MKPPIVTKAAECAINGGSGAKAYYPGDSTFMKKKMSKARRRADKIVIVKDTSR